jgi:hypothetical protein
VDGFQLHSPLNIVRLAKQISELTQIERGDEVSTIRVSGWVKAVIQN